MWIEDGRSTTGRAASTAAQVHRIWKMWNLTCEKPRDSTTENPGQSSNMGQEDVTWWKRHSAWAGGRTGALCFQLLLPVCGNMATLVLEASFNSKYFKTAVKSTGTFSPKIVSCEKNSFLKVHSSHHLYVYIHIFKKITLKAGWDRKQRGV